MRKNSNQTFTVIRKNGKKYMTNVSESKRMGSLPELFRSALAYLRAVVKRLQTVLTGTGGKEYVALSSVRLQGGMRVGRR